MSMDSEYSFDLSEALAGRADDDRKRAKENRLYAWGEPCPHGDVTPCPRCWAELPAQLDKHFADALASLLALPGSRGVAAPETE